jgi:hypothetical protein
LHRPLQEGCREATGVSKPELGAGDAGDAADLLKERFIVELKEAHADNALVKFEELIEAAVDLDAVPEEYLIDASYDAQLQVCAPDAHSSTSRGFGDAALTLKIPSVAAGDQASAGRGAKSCTE